MSPITTHVLDVSAGRPAGGVEVSLRRGGEGGPWRPVATGRTDADGRAGDLLAEDERLEAGLYSLRFEVEPYFASRDVRTFYPYVEVVFHLRDPEEHHHVPLLLSPWGYTTYRGS